MKNRFIEIVALILGALTALAGVLSLPAVAMLPASWQPYVALAIALVVVGKNGAYVILDFFDNGKLDQSYKVAKKIGMTCLSGLCLFLAQCTTETTTHPDGSVTVKRSIDSEALVAGGSVAGKIAPIFYKPRQAVPMTSGKEAVTVEPEPTKEASWVNLGLSLLGL